jgi:aryl-alcohol dehydrogenase-like predicted oxidoreductase
MTIPRFTLAPGYDVSRIIKGGWHLAGDHGAIDSRQAQADMAAFVEAGITTFDCADIYTGVEELIGAFRRAYPEQARKVQIHTKFVPDLPDLPRVDRRYVERIIDRSLARLGVEQIDLVQFHWWDYDAPGYVETALELERLRRAGKIGRLGATNFDVPRLRALIEAGAPIVSHQVQYSLIDERPQNGMVAFCAEQGVSLLCYGTVAGGFLSERWLGRPEPTSGVTNRSLIKYKLIIDDFGGWAAFQRLLGTLKAIAERRSTDIASVATRAILDRPQVAAAIVGATNTAHLPAHQAIGSLTLDEADRAAIAEATRERAGPLGDVYALERDRNGRHGQIMKYELNSA